MAALFLFNQVSFLEDYLKVYEGLIIRVDIFNYLFFRDLCVVLALLFDIMS